jgi:prevent-host-death family protein
MARPKKAWQLQEAKARLSALVKLADTEGPQEIAVRGETAAVLLSRADYDRLHRQRKVRNLSPFPGLIVVNPWRQ